MMQADRLIVANRQMRKERQRGTQTVLKADREHYNKPRLEKCGMNMLINREVDGI